MKRTDQVAHPGVTVSADPPAAARAGRSSHRAALTRRAFLSTVTVGTALATSGLAVTGCGGGAEAAEPMTENEQRKREARRVRDTCTQLAFERPLPDHPNNGEEEDYPYVANFTKGLPHDALGAVDPAAYRALLKALDTGEREDFEAIPLGGGRKLRNPQAGLAFDLEGPDSHHLALPPAPRIDGPENSGEMGELYWMALARDVNFTDYDRDPVIAAAAADLSSFSDFRGPKQGGVVTPATIFRGFTPGDLAGPYLSQFMLKDIPYGALTISQRQRTVLPGTDYLTDYDDWLRNVNGFAPASGAAFDSTRRYIRNGRDLPAYVQIDALYEAYLNACLILLGMGAPFNPGNPYNSLTTTDAFGTFGGPHILSLVTEVASRALKAVWYQKWFVHRRLRPEEFGGLVHNHLTGAATHPIDAEILDCEAVQRVFDAYGTYLLPQAFPEACPLHPAYGSGHATVAGACVTILKWWFDESFVIPDPVVPNGDGTELVPYTGSDAGALTVGGELNKVAANVASGRDFAGIHWRTDFAHAFTLGEAVAIGILEEQKLTYNEQGAQSFTKFDGTQVTV